MQSSAVSNRGIDMHQNAVLCSQQQSHKLASKCSPLQSATKLSTCTKARQQCASLRTYAQYALPSAAALGYTH
eukprot:1140771-Pelagomonas_calceolata.AAC.11